MRFLSIYCTEVAEEEALCVPYVLPTHSEQQGGSVLSLPVAFN